MEAAPVPMVSAGKHGRLQEAVVKGSGYLKVQIHRLSLVKVWVTVGTCPQCCNGETFGPPIKGCILYCKRVGQLAK